MPTIVVPRLASPPDTLAIVRLALEGASPEQGALILETLAELSEATLARAIEGCFQRNVRPLTDSHCLMLRDVLHTRRQWAQAWDLEVEYEGPDDELTTVDYHHCPTHVNL